MFKQSTLVLFQPTKEMSFCRPVINRGISHIPSQPLTSLLVFYYIGTTADAKAEKIHYSAKESHSAHHSNGRKELSIFPVNPDAAGATVFLHQFVFFIVLNVSSFNPCTFVCVAAPWALNWIRGCGFKHLHQHWCSEDKDADAAGLVEYIQHFYLCFGFQHMHINIFFPMPRECEMQIFG